MKEEVIILCKNCIFNAMKTIFRFSFEFIVCSEDIVNDIDHCLLLALQTHPSIALNDIYFFFRSLILPKRNTSRILHKFSINENPKTKAPNRAKQWT